MDLSLQVETIYLPDPAVEFAKELFPSALLYLLEDVLSFIYSHRL